MKFTLNWLKNYIDTGDLTADQLSDELTMLGLEVDSVTPLFADLADLKTGLVVSCESHPDADKLSLCQVQIGEETHQIVCGAPNVRKGLSVVVALPGTVLPGDFKIKKSKIRGVPSNGMICSERELGLSNEHDGIMELPVGTEHGKIFTQVMELDDLCIDVDLTPNRPDCASVIGVAREVASVVANPLKLPVLDASITKPSSDFSVEIKNPELCPRYAAKLIKNVEIGPSPWWLRKLLISVGLRPINNVVDITNFVMLEYGQPLHAFDFNNLADGKIIVRTPTDDELNFTTLDNSSRKLDGEMLMICDGRQPVAVAGVMGGLNSEVSEDTTNILLESACFNPVSIRKTARKLNLSTDASYRFERGVDPEGTINALERAAQLICELSGGTMGEDGVDCFPGKTSIEPVVLNVSRTNTLLGLALDSQEIADLLNSIELYSEIKDNDTIAVTPPSFRVDIEREADLVEEVARLYGYNKIPITLPSVDLSYPEQDPHRTKRLSICAKLTTVGFTEAINYSFIAEKHIELLVINAEDERTKSVRLLNPLSEDQAVMRTMLLPGLLENVKRNINFQKPAIKLFELGKVFFAQGPDEQPIEQNRLAGVLSGNSYGDSAPLYFKHTAVDIFDAKGCIEFILDEMNLGTISESTALQLKIATAENTEPFATPGYSLDLFHNETKIGSIGRFNNDVLHNFSIKNEVFYFDIDFDELCRLDAKNKKFSSLPVFPSVKRDIALVVEQHISAGELLSAVRNSSDKLIEKSEIFDVFQGEKIPAGFKSVALTITYRSSSKTLTEKNVEKSHSKIVSMLTEKFGGSFRNA